MPGTGAEPSVRYGTWIFTATLCGKCYYAPPFTAEVTEMEKLHDLFKATQLGVVKAGPWRPPRSPLG